MRKDDVLEWVNKKQIGTLEEQLEAPLSGGTRVLLFANPMVFPTYIAMSSFIRAISPQDMAAISTWVNAEEVPEQEQAEKQVSDDKKLKSETSKESVFSNPLLGVDMFKNQLRFPFGEGPGQEIDNEE